VFISFHQEEKGTKAVLMASHLDRHEEETERWKMMKLIFTMCIASEEGAVRSKEQSLVPGR
jgi:hypothetical protein